MTEAELVKAHRLANPRSRAVSMFRYVRNGSRCKQMGCVLCGAEGPTWDGMWRKTKRAWLWETEHRRMHLEGGAL